MAFCALVAVWQGFSLLNQNKVRKDEETEQKFEEYFNKEISRITNAGINEAMNEVKKRRCPKNLKNTPKK